MGFRLVPKSVTWNDPERCNHGGHFPDHMKFPDFSSSLDR